MTCLPNGMRPYFVTTSSLNPLYECAVIYAESSLDAAQLFAEKWSGVSECFVGELPDLERFVPERRVLTTIKVTHEFHRPHDKDGNWSA